MNIGQAENINRKGVIDTTHFPDVSIGMDSNKSNNCLAIKRVQAQYFHKSVTNILRMMQIFCLFPLNGYTGSDPRQLNHTRPRMKLLFNNILLVMGICEFLLMIRVYADRGVSVADLSRISFYLSSIYAVYALRRLAYQWKSLMMYWYNTEKSLLEKFYQNSEQKSNVIMKITVIATILLCLAIIDHVIFLLDDMTDATQLYQQCNVTKYSSWEFWLHKLRPQYFILFPYHPVLFIPVEWVHACLIFAWTMQDILIIVVSLALMELFSHWNSRIEKYESQVIPSRIWYELREDYTRLTELVVKVDQYLSTMILVSCASNLYQICSCVFLSSIPRPDVLDNLQFWYSFLFILFRTILVLHFVAEIHEKSVKSRLTIRCVPSKGWCSEIQRLLDQMVSMDIALSGRKLFYITRKTILIIVATVVTYEIVLVDRIPREPLRKKDCH